MYAAVEGREGRAYMSTGGKGSVGVPGKDSSSLQMKRARKRRGAAERCRRRKGRAGRRAERTADMELGRC